MKWKREKRTMGRTESLRYVSEDGRVEIQKFTTRRRGRKPYQRAPQWGNITEAWYRVVIDGQGVRDLRQIERLCDAKSEAEARYCPKCNTPCFKALNRKRRDGEREKNQWYWSASCTECSHEVRDYVVETPCSKRRCRFNTETLEGEPAPERCGRCNTALETE